MSNDDTALMPLRKGANLAIQQVSQSLREHLEERLADSEVEKQLLQTALEEQKKRFLEELEEQKQHLSTRYQMEAYSERRQYDQRLAEAEEQRKALEQRYQMEAYSERRQYDQRLAEAEEQRKALEERIQREYKNEIEVLTQKLNRSKNQNQKFESFLREMSERYMTEIIDMEKELNLARDRAEQLEKILRQNSKYITQNLQELENQLVSLEAKADDQIRLQIQSAIQIVEQTKADNKLLTAQVILPSAEDMSVRLVPLHSLERLEEYRSDENKAFLLIGIFAGSVLGVVGNWATGDLTISRVSIFMLVVMLVLTFLTIYWARVIAKRSDNVRRQIFKVNLPPVQANQLTPTQIQQIPKK